MWILISQFSARKIFIGCSIVGLGKFLPAFFDFIAPYNFFLVFSRYRMREPFSRIKCKLNWVVCTYCQCNLTTGKVFIARHRTWENVAGTSCEFAYLVPNSYFYMLFSCFCIIVRIGTNIYIFLLITYTINHLNSIKLHVIRICWIVVM